MEIFIVRRISRSIVRCHRLYAGVRRCGSSRVTSRDKVSACELLRYTSSYAFGNGGLSSVADWKNGGPRVPSTWETLGRIGFMNTPKAVRTDGRPSPNKSQARPILGWTFASGGLSLRDSPVVDV